ncbi:hypothetical protein [Streptomyces klenkii]|uniref:hypothetical protein n=1 Tax=Streptomyces klenkii TaxID=1420899 RepID=UPI003BAE4E8C
MALKQARRSQCRFRVGAVLVQGGRTLALASNVPRNSPSIDYKHASFHAEEVIVRRVGAAPRAVLYVARVDRAGSPMLARPCRRCQFALYAAGITRAHYTTSQGFGLVRIQPQRPQ